MKTFFANMSHGNEPYVLAANVGISLGDVIIPQIYHEKQRQILKRWFGSNPRIYLDRRGGNILRPLLFDGDYASYINRVVRYKKALKRKLERHLKNFEAVSLTGEKKSFANPDVELNIGSPFRTSARQSFYIFPGLLSEYAENCPVKVENIGAFIDFARENEAGHEKIFIPEINSFSYRKRKPKKNEISTPPLKRKGNHKERINQAILVTLPGAATPHSELIGLAGDIQKYGFDTYRLAEDTKLHGKVAETHEIIFNPNLKAVLARAGWGTLWLCQVAEKPIITPCWKQTDDPEIYHNNLTIKELGLGVVYKNFGGKVIAEALSKVGKIKELNKGLFDKFGTLDGISFVQQKIKEML